MSEIYVVVDRSDGSVAHLALQSAGRFGSQPEMRSGWERLPDGMYGRAMTPAVIDYEVGRFSQMWGEGGDATAIGWRILTQEEHEFFGRDRTYRDAIEHVGGKIQHNMVKARELHRGLIRHLNGDRFMTLDREWLDAAASKDSRKADEVEAKRALLRNFVDDPRIDAAQDIETLKALLPPEV